MSFASLQSILQSIDDISLDLLEDERKLNLDFLSNPFFSVNLNNNWPQVSQKNYLSHVIDILRNYKYQNIIKYDNTVIKGSLPSSYFSDVIVLGEFFFLEKLNYLKNSQ